MKIVRFSQGGGQASLGVLNDAGDAVTPLSEPAADLVTLIESGAIAGAELSGESIALADVVLDAPIMPRRNIFCVGKNYHAHAAEFHKSGFDSSAGAAASPDAPIVFTKAPSTVIGPDAPIPAYLDDTNSTDYEGELGVIIGKGGRGIAAADAMDHVFGFTIINDVTARDLQQKHRQWFLGKSIDGFCPLGPCVATKDEIADLGAAELRTYVDGELRQRSTFANMIFDIPTLIETISRGITLMPGDIIATGTPEGVGIGYNPPKFLADGEVVRVEIDGIGAIENRIAGKA